MVAHFLGHVLLLQLALGGVRQGLEVGHGTHDHGGSHLPGVVPVAGRGGREGEGEGGEGEGEGRERVRREGEGGGERK